MALLDYFRAVSLGMQVRSGVGGADLVASGVAGSLRSLGASIAQAKAEVLARADAAIAEGTAAILKEAPIEELEKLGVRVGALRGGGILTVHDLEGKSAWQLQRIRGVGEVTAEEAVAARDRYKAAARSEVRVLPDPDSPRPSDGALLVAVARYDALVRNLPDRIKEADRRLTLSLQALQRLKAETKLLGLLFSSERRAALKEAHDKVLAELGWVQQEVALLRQYEDGLRPVVDDIRRLYEQNSSAFVAVLEALLPTKQPAAPIAGVIADEKGGLPSEIAAEVEATKLEKGPLLATLRRYQQFGAQYLVCRKRVVLGDDMGLGKTVQVLGAMCHLSALGATRFFVVCPNSVLINWEREVGRHTGLKAVVIHGADREDEVELWKNEGGVGITTFATLSKIVHLLGDVDLLAVDEAHAVKNPEAQRTQAVLTLSARAKHLVLMTGTALENRLAEMHTLVAAAQPELQDLLKQLLWQVRPKPNEIRRQLAPVYLRRTQADVLNELPDLVHNDEIIPLEPADRQAYESAPVHLMQRRLAATVGQGGLNSAKYDRLRQLLESYEDEGRKVAIFSTFLQVLSDVSELSGRCPVIHGGVATEERQKMIDAFTAKEGFAVLALQIDAGGLGINLQSAQVVVLMEPQFKPSTEKQAVARVRRMGQTRKVHAHRLIAQGTVDEALVALVEAKTKIFEDYAQHSAVKSASRMAVDGASGALLEELKAEVGRTG